MWRVLKRNISKPFKEREAYIRDHLIDPFYLGVEDGSGVGALYAMGGDHFVRVLSKPNSGLGIMSFRAIHCMKTPRGYRVMCDMRFSFGELKGYLAKLSDLYSGRSINMPVYPEEGVVAHPYSSLPWVKSVNGCEPDRSKNQVTRRKDGFIVCTT